MLEIKVNKKHIETLIVEGKPIDIASELGLVVNRLYSMLNNHDRDAAKDLKRDIEAVFTDESPTWESQEFVAGSLTILPSIR